MFDLLSDNARDKSFILYWSTLSLLSDKYIWVSVRSEWRGLMRNAALKFNLVKHILSNSQKSAIWVGQAYFWNHPFCAAVYHCSIPIEQFFIGTFQSCCFRHLACPSGNCIISWFYLHIYCLWANNLLITWADILQGTPSANCFENEHHISWT